MLTTKKTASMKTQCLDLPLEAWRPNTVASVATNQKKKRHFRDWHTKPIFEAWKAPGPVDDRKDCFHNNGLNAKGYFRGRRPERILIPLPGAAEASKSQPTHRRSASLENSHVHRMSASCVLLGTLKADSICLLYPNRHSDASLAIF